MSEMAKAYVQIVPSAKGIHGSVKSIMEPEATSAGESSGAAVGNGIVSKLKTVLVAAGIGAIIKSALDAGGAVQQSFGGLDTIYGEAGDLAKKFAQNASEYGLSMNDYAEQAVSFGAALKSAFDGNTVAAAASANLAIRDMADNSAKMGTDITSIQTAYQGFAKQNYTMLDNLKLGYGGTKTEMERLLKDAEKLSGVKYDINNLGDVYSAIHVIQQDLGLTGVAAAEASETFTGSLGAMKASATNLLATLTTGGDVTNAFSVLGQNVQNFVMNNLMPMIGSLINALPTVITQASALIGQMAPQLITMLTQGIVQNLPMLLDTATQLLTGIITGLMQMAPMLIDAAITIIQTLSDYIMQNLEPLLELGFQLIEQIAFGILENLPALIDTVTQLLLAFTNYILDNLPMIIEMGMQLVTKLMEGVIANFPEIAIAAISLIGYLLLAIGEHLPEILETGIKMIGELVTGFINALPKVKDGIVEIIEGIKAEFADKIEDFKEAGKNIITGVAEGIKAAASQVYDAIKRICEDVWESVKDFFDINSPSRLMEWGGAMLPAGMAKGIEKNKNLVLDAMAAVNNGIMDALGTTMNADITASRSAVINLHVVGEIDGQPILQMVNNNLGVAI